MLYPFASDGVYDIGISEIQIIDGIKHIRVMKEEPNWETGHFKIVNFLLPSKKILSNKGYTEEENNELINDMSNIQDVLFEVSEDYRKGILD